MRFFIAVFLILSSLVIPLMGSAAPREDETLPLWDNNHPSDKPLEGESVIRRDKKYMPEFKRTWILVIDGIEHDGGLCGYSLGFSEPIRTAVPKIFWQSAFDPDACRFEFIVGEPVSIEIPHQDGGEYETSETSLPKPHALVTPLSLPLRYASANPSAVVQGPDYFPFPNIKLTVYGEFKDPAQIVVNKTLTAVNAHIDSDNSFDKAHCINDRWWLTKTGWENASSGYWHDTSCESTTRRLKGSTNARYKNHDFILCIEGPAVTWYDNLWAKVRLDANGDGYFDFNITEADFNGALCHHLLHWGDLHDYPYEYWGLENP